MLQQFPDKFVISHLPNYDHPIKFFGHWQMEFRIVHDNTLTIWFGRNARSWEDDALRLVQIAKFTRCISIVYELNRESGELELSVACDKGVQDHAKYNEADVWRYHVRTVLNDREEDSPFNDFRYHFSSEEIEAALAWANAKLKQRLHSQNAAMRNVYFVDTPHTNLFPSQVSSVHS